MREKSNVYLMGAIFLMVLGLAGKIITGGTADNSILAGGLIMCILFLGEIVTDYEKQKEPGVEKANSKQFVIGKSDAYNDGWESFFIDRELSDNPHSAGSESHNDWSEGFRAAQASTNN
jgi:hypothetical protein